MPGFIQVAGIKNLVFTPEKKILLPTEPPPKPSRVETFGTTTQGGSCYHLHPTVPQVLLALLTEQPEAALPQPHTTAII